jgi:hypothetical protein
MACCRFLLAAGTRVSSKLVGWRFSDPYKVCEFHYDENFVVLKLFPSNQIIKFSLCSSEDIYTILTCRHSFIVTFRFNKGAWARIEGTCHLDPPFYVGDTDFFDVTISNQSQNFAKLFQLLGNRRADHLEAMSILLMTKFPLEDQGMVLIYGPLPSGRTSYPANNIFDIDMTRFKIDAENGLGLVVKVDDEHVKVQYGNSAHMLDRDVLSSQYSTYSTGLPSPV